MHRNHLLILLQQPLHRLSNIKRMRYSVNKSTMTSLSPFPIPLLRFCFRSLSWRQEELIDFFVVVSATGHLPNFWRTEPLQPCVLETRIFLYRFKPYMVFRRILLCESISMHLVHRWFQIIAFRHLAKVIWEQVRLIERIHFIPLMQTVKVLPLIMAFFLFDSHRRSCFSFEFDVWIYDLKDEPVAPPRI